MILAAAAAERDEAREAKRRIELESSAQRATQSRQEIQAKLLREAEEELIRAGAVEPGDLIVLTIGEPIGQPGGTNTLKIIKVGEHLSSH